MSRRKTRFRKLEHALRRFRRRYLRAGSSLTELFGQLDEAKCRYVVLRWFEDLPAVEKGEDVDILIDNRDLETLRSRLSRGLAQRAAGRKPLKLDIHGVHPEPKQVSYYPPQLSERILQNAVQHPSGARVPSPEDHFFSLAFHALYRKGLASGLPRDGRSPPVHRGEDRYRKTLARLAAELDFRVEITLEDLDRFLAEHGWRPTLDYIEKRRSKDPWHRSLVARAYAELPAKPGLAVFLLREAMLSKPEAPDLVKAFLDEEGFNIIASKVLAPEERGRVASELRGGDWGIGPYLRSGGPPAVAIVAMDVFPRKPSPKVARQHPDLDNELVHASKSSIRKWWNSEQPEAGRCNVVHTSDNCVQALAYVQIVAPELVDEVLAEADRLLAEIDLGGEVVHQFQHRGRRSVVELIRQGDGQVVVRKTFRPGRETYFRREVDGIRELAKITPETTPEILECGRNYFTMPYYKTKLTQKLKLPMPVPALRKVFHSAQKFFDHGYVMLDFRPHNLIVSGRNEVKIIDYENMFNCAGEREFFARYSFVDFINGRIPKYPFPQKAVVADGRKYFRSWGRSTAVPLESLLHDPLYMIYLKRWTIGYYVWMRAMLTKTVRWKKPHDNGLG